LFVKIVELGHIVNLVYLSRLPKPRPTCLA
jgi:hypothetical protein